LTECNLLHVRVVVDRVRCQTRSLRSCGWPARRSRAGTFRISVIRWPSIGFLSLILHSDTVRIESSTPSVGTPMAALTGLRGRQRSLACRRLRTADTLLRRVWHRTLSAECREPFQKPFREPFQKPFREPSNPLWDKSFRVSRFEAPDARFAGNKRRVGGLLTFWW